MQHAASYGTVLTLTFLVVGNAIQADAIHWKGSQVDALILGYFELKESGEVPVVAEARECGKLLQAHTICHSWDVVSTFNLWSYEPRGDLCAGDDEAIILSFILRHLKYNCPGNTASNRETKSLAGYCRAYEQLARA